MCPYLVWLVARVYMLNVSLFGVVGGSILPVECVL